MQVYKSTIVLLLPFAATAADLDGNALYQQHCATSHGASSATRAPGIDSLRAMTPEAIVKTLETGIMKEQGSRLNVTEKQTVAEFLTGKTVGEARPVSTVGQCPAGAVLST
jgi:mono/diheme cytochrome c family protein